MTLADHRHFQRADVDFPVVLQVDSDPQTSSVASAINISVDGVLLRSVRGLPINVPLILHFPFEWERAFAIIKCLRRDAHLYGCQFIDLSERVYHSLDHAVVDYAGNYPEKRLHTLWRHL